MSAIACVPVLAAGASTSLADAITRCTMSPRPRSPVPAAARAAATVPRLRSRAEENVSASATLAQRIVSGVYADHAGYDPDWLLPPSRSTRAPAADSAGPQVAG